MRQAIFSLGSTLLLLVGACSTDSVSPVAEGLNPSGAGGMQQTAGETKAPANAGSDVVNTGSGGDVTNNPTAGSGSVTPSGGSSGTQTVTGGTDVVVNPIDSGTPDGNGTVTTNPDNQVGPDEPNTPVVTSGEPILPEVTGDCPNFAPGAFNFMGLSGLMDAGQGSGGPLVFFWHGTVMAANSYLGIPVARITGEGGVIVSPNGPAAGEAGAMCSGTMIFGDTTTWDIVDQITACAVRDHGIDPHRIYATGCSAGGLQTGCMAGRRSNYMAAVAPNSGGLVMPVMSWQNPGHIPAVMTMHGGPSDVVGVNFTQTSGALDSVTKAAGGFAIDCNHGGMHCGAPGSLYNAAITFFYAHPFGFEESPYVGGLPADFPPYCTIYNE